MNFNSIHAIVGDLRLLPWSTAFGVVVRVRVATPTASTRASGFLSRTCNWAFDSSAWTSAGKRFKRGAPRPPGRSFYRSGYNASVGFSGDDGGAVSGVASSFRASGVFAEAGGAFEADSEAEAGPFERAGRGVAGAVGRAFREAIVGGAGGDEGGGGGGVGPSLPF